MRKRERQQAKQQQQAEQMRQWRRGTIVGHPLEQRITDQIQHWAGECVSTQSGYSDPWAEVTQHKLLGSRTKERVLCSVARAPKTIARLAKELGLSQPTIHTHVNAMLDSELLHESVDLEKKHPSENYYEPNFPVVSAADRAALEQLCQEMAGQFAEFFETRRTDLERAIETTSVAQNGWDFAELAQYCYASVQRSARRLLEERGMLSPRQSHRNGAAWLFWAEDSHRGVQSPARDRSLRDDVAAAGGTGTHSRRDGPTRPAKPS